MADEELPNGYAESLRTALEETGTSKRGLAAELAARLGSTVESERRSINRYVAGDQLPGRERADLIAEILGRPELAEVSVKRTARIEALERRVDELSRQLSDVQQQSYDLSLTGRMIEEAIADPTEARKHLPDWERLADVYARWADALRDLVDRLERDDQSNAP